MSHWLGLQIALYISVHFSMPAFTAVTGKMKGIDSEACPFVSWLIFLKQSESNSERFRA
jgi:hypothetical protein